MTQIALTMLALLGAPQAPAQDSWSDRSPHKVGFVTGNGVKLQYLDWGGKGAALLFLAGMEAPHTLPTTSLPDSPIDFTFSP